MACVPKCVVLCQEEKEDDGCYIEVTKQNAKGDNEAYTIAIPTPKPKNKAAHKMSPPKCSTPNVGPQNPMPPVCIQVPKGLEEAARTCVGECGPKICTPNEVCVPFRLCPPCPPKCQPCPPPRTPICISRCLPTFPPPCPPRCPPPCPPPCPPKCSSFCIPRCPPACAPLCPPPCPPRYPPPCPPLCPPPCPPKCPSFCIPRCPPPCSPKCPSPCPPRCPPPCPPRCPIPAVVMCGLPPPCPAPTYMVCSTPPPSCKPDPCPPPPPKCDPPPNICPPKPSVTVSWPQPPSFCNQVVNLPLTVTEGNVICDKMVPCPPKINKLLLYLLTVFMPAPCPGPQPCPPPPCPPPACPIAIPCTPKLICIPCPAPPVQPCPPEDEDESWPFAVPTNFPGVVTPKPQGVKVLPPPAKRICPPWCLHVNDIRPELWCMYDRGPRKPCRAHCFGHVPKRNSHLL